MTEEWRPCPGHEGRYEVSSFGRLRSLPRVESCANGHRVVSGGILNPMLSKDGYPQVSLRIGGKLRTMQVHRLICRAFHGEQPNPLHKEVCHLDGCRTNARADNLKWVSRGENISHKTVHGTNPTGERHPQAKLKTEQVAAIKARLLARESCAKLAREYGVSAHCIDSIKRGRNWRHVAPRVSHFAGER